MRCKRLLSLILAVCLVMTYSPMVFAEESGELDPEVLLVKGGKTITIHTTIDEVRQMFGQEKLKTISIFGGSAYTFYGEDYSDYLFLETDSQGRIVAYNTIGDDFVCGEGDYMYIHMDHRIVRDWSDNSPIGAMGGWYSPELWSGQDKPMERYKSDAAYAIAIAQHTVPMWNAVSKNAGLNNNIRFDEKTFYINRQLTENNSNLDEYCQATHQSSYFNAIYSGGYVEYIMQEIVTPFTYAASANGYNITENEYAVFDWVYGEERNQIIIGRLDPAFYDEWQYIPYTEEEQALLNNAREIYAESVETFNSTDSYFLAHPQYDVLPLEPGVIDESKLVGATGFLNAIRAGAGLPLLEHDPELSEGCQYKAALTRYLAINGIDNPSPHFPPQPEGISDEYYAKAQLGSGENLFMGDVIRTIIYALDDTYGDPITCGHRNALLNPNWKYFGVGSSEVDGNISFGIQGVQKFSGYQECDVEMVGWPSKGIMLAESLGRDYLTCTAMFQHTYQPTDQTGVVFTCLNTGNTIEFEAGLDNTGEKELHINSSMVTYSSADINLVVGNVYEITITNLLNENTGELEDYTYRSVYETAYLSENANPTGLTLDKTVLSVDVDKKAKLYATIAPAEAENKMVKWSSDNEAVAKVNENGYVTGISYGTATITAETDNGITAVCTVTVEPHVHSFGEWVEITAPTTESEGLEQRSCDCGETESRSIDKLTSETTAPIIPEESKPQETTPVESVPQETGPNESQPEETEPVHTHSWTKWNIDQNPTSTTEGKRSRKCTGCGETQTETLAKLSIEFKDVPDDQYYALPVDWAVQNKITTGTSSTTFAPDDKCTRGQIVTFLWRAAGEPEPIGTINPFKDVAKDAYYYKAVLWAVEQGITTGTSANTFSPNDGCTRGQVATFLWRSQGKPAAVGKNPFTDVKAGEYYYEAVIWAVEQGITTGTSATTFAPNTTCTRGQIVTFLYRAMGDQK